MKRDDNDLEGILARADAMLPVGDMHRRDNCFYCGATTTVGEVLPKGGGYRPICPQCIWKSMGGDDGPSNRAGG